MSKYDPKVKYQLPNQKGVKCDLQVPEQLAYFLDDLPEERRIIKQKAFPTSTTVEAHKTKSVEADKRYEVSIITTDSVDIDGESIDPMGLIFNRFQQLPSVYIGHDYSMDCYLKCLWWKPIINGFKAATWYPYRPATFPESVVWIPDLQWELATNTKTQTGKSIGFIELESGIPTEQEVEAQPALVNCHNRIRKALMLEYSNTGIPINSDCFVIEEGKPEEKAVKSKGFHDVLKGIMSKEQKFHNLLKKQLHKDR